MKIGGFQKLTLLDYPGHIAATIFLVGCNFRCPFCHNIDLIENTDNILSIDFNEVLSYLKNRFNKLQGVAITGGEPLINDDLEDLIIKIKNIGYKIKLDTNGFYFEHLKKIIDNHLVDMVAMDIKSGFTKYYKVCGLNKINIENIYNSINILINSNIEYEFRTTCVNGIHDLDDFIEIKEMIKGAKKYFLQNYNSNDKIKHLNYKSFSKNELETFLNIVKDNVEFASIRGL